MRVGHFDLIARLYDSVFRFQDAARLLNLLQAAPGHRVLDVGGGTGRVSEHLGQDLNVVICDPSRGMLGEARRKGMRACAGMAEHMPFANRAFDRIIVIDSVHHFQSANTAAAELLRVLRPGGRLLIEEPDIRQFSVKLIALAERLLLMRSRFLSVSDLVHLFEAQGGIVVAADENCDLSVSLVLSRRE